MGSSALESEQDDLDSEDSYSRCGDSDENSDTESTGILSDNRPWTSTATQSVGVGSTSAGFAATTALIGYAGSPPVERLPVERLPVELLVEIFTEVAEEYGHGTETLCEMEETPCTKMRWVSLMLVCPRWRQIGLTTPKLWRIISVTPDRLHTLQFRLSRSLGSTIDLFFKANSEPAIPLLLLHAPQIRSIWTTCSFEYEDISSIKPLFDIPLLALEHLHIMPDKDILHPTFWESRNDPSTTEEYFDLELTEERQPRMHTIIAARLVLLSTPAFYSNLRKLRLEIHDNKDNAMRAREIVDIIAHAPLLELLTINALPKGKHRPRPQSSLADGCLNRPIVLPHLRRIRISGLYWFIVEVLGPLRAPNLRSLHVDTTLPAAGASLSDDAHSTALLFPPAFRHILSQCSSLCLLTCGRSGFAIGDSLSRYHGDRDPSGRISLSVGCESRRAVGDSFSSALKVLCDVFSTARSVRTLWVEHFTTNAPTIVEWEGVFHAFPSLRTLRLSGCVPIVVSPILNALLSLSNAGEHVGLECIVMQCALLNTLRSYDLIKLVSEVARTYAGRGSPFREVSLDLYHSNGRPFLVHEGMVVELLGQCLTALYFNRVRYSAQAARRKKKPKCDEAAPGMIIGEGDEKGEHKQAAG